jgi:hypothetical protein
MNTKVAFPFITGVALSGLLGCSTPHKVEERIASTSHSPQWSVPLPKYEFRGQLEPEPNVQSGQVCQLGTSCLTMDPRPFEPCLLSTRHCSDKAAEPMLVERPLEIIPAPQIVSR